MKRNLVIKPIIALLMFAGLAFFSCEKVPTEADARAQGNGEATHMGQIGLEIDDEAGVFKVFIDGEEVTSGSGLGKVTANVNGEVTLTDVDYTPMGCANFSTVKTRTITLTFTKTSNGSTLSDVYASLANTLNLNAANGVTDGGDNSITGGETFTVAYTVILSTCTNFTIFFDLEGTVN